MLLLLLLQLLPLLNYAQFKSTTIGTTVTLEAGTRSSLRPGFGITAERRLTKHSGFETGLFYRSYKAGWIATFTPGGLRTFNIIENYISVPVLYKYYTNVVNVSAGPCLDYFTGWNQTTGKPDIDVVDYTVHNKLQFGLQLKLSKAININKKISISPELRGTLNITNEMEYLGFGIAAGYKL